MALFARLAAVLLLLAPLSVGAQLTEAQVEDLAAQAKAALRLGAERIEQARAANVPLMVGRTTRYGYPEPVPGYLPRAVNFSRPDRPLQWTREALEARLYPGVLRRLRGDMEEIDRDLTAWRSDRRPAPQRSVELSSRFAFGIGIDWVWNIHLDDAALQIEMLRFELAGFHEAAQRDIEAKFKEIAQRHGKDFEKIRAEQRKVALARDAAWKDRFGQAVAEYRSIFDRLAAVRAELIADVKRWDSYLRGLGLSGVFLSDPEEDFIPEDIGSRAERPLDRFYRPRGGAGNLSDLNLPNLTLIELVDPVVQHPSYSHILTMTGLFGGRMLDPASGRIVADPTVAARPVPPVAVKPPPGPAPAPAVARAPEMVSPNPGSVLPEGPITFEWRDNGTVIDAWSLIVPAQNLHRRILTADPAEVASRRITLDELPAGARDVAAQLWYRTAGEWRHVEVRYSRPQARPEAPAAAALQFAVSTDDSLEGSLPAADELLVFVHRDKAFILPARFNALKLPEGRQMVESLATEATIGKRGWRVVNGGFGNGGFAVAFDAGGSLPVFPHALEEVKRALQVSSLRDVILMHIDRDHVESLGRLAAAERIRRIIVPEEFLVNPEAPRSDLARIIARANLGDRLQRLRAPPGEGFFHGMEFFGDATVEWYGENSMFRKLAEQRARGDQNQSARDAASLLLVVTHNPSQTRIAFVGDLRGQDIARLFDVMGRERFQAMLNGVTVVSGWSHHMGRLERADHRGWAELYEATFLRSGRLDVMVQAGNQYNRALVDALIACGVNVHVAKAPPSPDRVGSITLATDGQIRHSGRHATDEFIAGSRTMERVSARTATLSTALEALRDYPHELPASLRRAAKNLQAEYASLRQAALHVFDTAMSGVPEKAPDIYRPGLRNPAAVEAAVRAAAAVRFRVDPQETLWRLGEWGKFRPFYGQFRDEVARARKTGRLSRAGIAALAGLNYFYVAEVLRNAGFPEAERQRILRAYPKVGTTVPFRQRAGSAAVLLMTLAADVAVHWPEVRTWFFNMDVAPSLSDFEWWETKGVFVEVDGVDDNLDPFWKNERTQRRERVVALLRERELSHMAMTGVPEFPPGAHEIEEGAFRLTNWDLFTGWASVGLLNLRDWHHHIVRSKSIKPATGASGCERDRPGPGVENFAWCYRTHRITDRPGVYLVSESWRRDENLTRILRAAAASMIDRTEVEIARLAHSAGPSRQPGPEGNLVPYFQREIFEGKPKALRKVRFVNGVDTIVYSTELDGSSPARSHGGFDADSVFYQFEPGEIPGLGPIPEGYVLLGGADYETYNKVYAIEMVEVLRGGDGSARIVRGPNTTELVLGWAADLTEVR